MAIDYERKYSNEIRTAIEKAKKKRAIATVAVKDGTEVYAYAGPYDDFSWGINTVKDGCVLRGIRGKDGSDRIKMRGHCR